MFLFCACEPEAPASVLMEEAYIDPEGLFSMPYPRDWQYAYNAEKFTATFSPIEQAETQNPLTLKVYAVRTPSSTIEESGAEARELFDIFLTENMDEANEVYSTGNTTVDHQKAAVIDFGKPAGSGYSAGRIVMVYAPGYAVIFLGGADRETWEAFLPTFRLMLSEFIFLPIE